MYVTNELEEMDMVAITTWYLANYLFIGDRVGAQHPRVAVETLVILSQSISESSSVKN